MNLMLRFSVLIVIICAGIAKSDDEASYSNEVARLFKDLRASYKVNVDIAKEKMNTFANETLDRKYAIAMINLYTQGSSFYSTLNYEMRNEYPNSTTNIWSRAGELINKGLDILGPKLYDKVYRGCSKLDTLPVAGATYSFNQIISTSLKKGTAVGFIGCAKGKLFVIENVYGVLAEEYSAFKFEREIIVKSTNIFLVRSGPVVENHYSVFHLDGQAEVNNAHAQNEKDEPKTIESKDVNGVNRPCGSLIKYCIVFLLFFKYLT